jgi:hypothetical protein
MFGFGYGRNFMGMRLALLAALLLAGAAFHRHGAAYGAVRVIYYVAIIALIGLFMTRRSSMRRDSGMSPAPDQSRQFPPAGYPPPSQVPYGAPDNQGEYPFPSGQYSQPQYQQPAYQQPATYQQPAYQQPAHQQSPYQHDPQQAEGPFPFGYSAPAPAGQPQPGWYPDPTDVNVQHYWDGSAWISRQRWDGNQWLPD